MTKWMTVKIGTLERAKKFVSKINQMDCEFDMVFGQTALDAKVMENLMGLDVQRTQRLNIYGNTMELQRAELELAEFQA